MNRKFLVFIILIAAGFSAWFSKDFAMKSFENYYNKIAQAQSSKQESRNNNAEIKAGDTLKQDTKESIANESLNKDDDLLKLENINKLYKSNTGNIEKPASTQEVPHLNEYRHYLFNISQLLACFLQDKAYSNQIAYARILNLPPSIDAILELFEQYNIDYLISGNEDYKRVFPKDCSLTKKFVKIKKRTPLAIDKQQLKVKIINNLELFQDYIYSEELQKIFTGRKE